MTKIMMRCPNCGQTEEFLGGMPHDVVMNISVVEEFNWAEALRYLPDPITLVYTDGEWDIDSDWQQAFMEITDEDVENAVYPSDKSSGYDWLLSDVLYTLVSKCKGIMDYYPDVIVLCERCDYEGMYEEFVAA